MTLAIQHNAFISLGGFPECGGVSAACASGNCWCHWNGFEPSTFSLQGSCSTNWSYSGLVSHTLSKQALFVLCIVQMAGMTRIELALPDRQSGCLTKCYIPIIIGEYTYIVDLSVYSSICWQERKVSNLRSLVLETRTPPLAHSLNKPDLLSAVHGTFSPFPPRLPTCIGSYPGGELEGVNFRSVTLAQLIYLCVCTALDVFPWYSISSYICDGHLI